MDLQQFLKNKAQSAPEGYNWIASLHPNTWYYCAEDYRVFNGGRYYKLAGLFEGEVEQWFKLEDLLELD